MSEVKVNKISPRTACGTTTLGDSGDSFVIPSGVTITNNGTQTGFGRTGAVDWETTPKTSTFTGVSGKGYFINSGSAITCNLPAGTAGDIIAFSDYARNFNTYNLTIAANGSEKIGGVADDAKLSVNGQAATFVYVDSTKGWVNVQNAEDTKTGAPPFIVATGGTITTSGDDKIHTFTGPGTFTVCNAAGVCGPTRNLVSYLVIAGGGAGGSDFAATSGGGGGAGGYRELKSPLNPYTASPLDGYPTPANRVTVSTQGYPITVGGGATANPTGPGPETYSSGSNSIFSTITSTGGGGGASNRCGSPSPSRVAGTGGSGGGANYYSGVGGTPGAAGNTPPTTPAQGFAGGDGGPGSSSYGSGGGGGATAAGGNGTAPTGGDGGAGATSSINATPTARAGGGGGAGWQDGPPTSAGAGGTGGGGAGGADGGNPGTAGTCNTGGGGGGASGASADANTGGNGGSALVIIRYKYQ